MYKQSKRSKKVYLMEPSLQEVNSHLFFWEIRTTHFATMFEGISKVHFQRVKLTLSNVGNKTPANLAHVQFYHSSQVSQDRIIIR